MAKNKFLTQEEFEKTYNTGEQLSFYVKSPFSEITDPPSILFTAVHWNKFNVTGATGTAYVCREGDCSHPVKLEALSFRPDENRNVKIEHVEKKSLGYHYPEKLPIFLEKQAPDEIKERVEETIKKLGPTL